ncbi:MULTISPECIES: hypothetical protein [unclassified Streptomyces]|nr:MULTISPECIES: hypothetical protein [unclassified Streptomyces]WSC48149.1 hypothetical protein OIE61_31580 [Streptomyces sp. NBC_01762]WSD27798.1 hypothetical protein OHA26_32295 [Streptomyces sp. NBC_01751]WSF83736.1 hypothetical protein OIE70_12025 [Streptomyces sp. NBC_01744]
MAPPDVAHHRPERFVPRDRRTRASTYATVSSAGGENITVGTG